MGAASSGSVCRRAAAGEEGLRVAGREEPTEKGFRLAAGAFEMLVGHLRDREMVVQDLGHQLENAENIPQ